MGWLWAYIPVVGEKAEKEGGGEKQRYATNVEM